MATSGVRGFTLVVVKDGLLAPGGGKRVSVFELLDGLGLGVKCINLETGQEPLHDQSHRQHEQQVENLKQHNHKAVNHHQQ